MPCTQCKRDTNHCPTCGRDDIPVGYDCEAAQDKDPPDPCGNPTKDKATREDELAQLLADLRDLLNARIYDGAGMEPEPARYEQMRMDIAYAWVVDLIGAEEAERRGLI